MGKFMQLHDFAYFRSESKCHICYVFTTIAKTVKTVFAWCLFLEANVMYMIIFVKICKFISFLGVIV